MGVLVPDITNPFYFDLIRGGTQLQLKAAGYTQLLVDTEESDEVEASTLEQLRKSADGVIVAASRLNDEALAAAAARMPMVTVNRDVDGVPAVIIDTPSAMPQALDHLISLGHTSVAYVSGPAVSQSAPVAGPPCQKPPRNAESRSAASGPLPPRRPSPGQLLQMPPFTAGLLRASSSMTSSLSACCSGFANVVSGCLRT